MKTLKIFLFFIILIGHHLYAQKPDIISVNKKTGNLGDVVTISGNGFSSTVSKNIVYFGAAKAEVINATSSTLEVSVPPGATFDQLSVTNTDSKLTGYSTGKFLLNFNGYQQLDKERLKEKIEIQEEDGLFDLCICDFNNDGLNDIATTNNRDRNYSITPYINITPAGETGIKFQRFNDPNFLIGEETRNITCGDLDGDGKKDLIVGKGGNIADRIYLFRNISTTSVVKFSTVTTLVANIGATQASTRRLKVYDLDNDGKPEIIMTDQRNSYVHIFKNNSVPGELRFSRTDRVLIPTERITLGLDIADINGDGKADIVYGSNLGSNVYVALNRSNNGSLSFDAPKTVAVSGDLVNLVTTDIDMDGDQDIIVANFVNNIFVLLNESTKSTVKFASPKIYDTGRLPFGIDVGDINGDGKPDLVVTTNEASEPLTILENRTSNNTLSLYQHYVGSAEVQRNVKIGDFSGDGKPDIGYTIDGVNKVGILRNQHCVGAKISPEPPNKICADNPSELIATKALKVNYNWINLTTNLPVDADGHTIGAVAPGEYQVTIVSANDNCESVSPKVLVELGGDNLPPTPVITGPEAVCEGGSFTLTSNSVAGVTYHWQKPDGAKTTGSSLSVTNASGMDAGKYSLVLEEDGCRTAPVAKTVDISIVPNLEITATQGENFCDGTTNILKVASLTNGVYLWYKNGQPVDGTSTNELAVSEAGNYSVKFTNEHLCSSQSDPFSTSKVAAPEASFTANENACLNETISFANTSTVASTVAPHYLWNFGNDNIYEGKNATWTFKNKGSYTVSLTVSYGNQYCQDSFERTITVAEAEGISISVNGETPTDENTRFCEGDFVTLSVDNSLSDIVWSDGSKESSINAYESGDYSVSATVSNNYCNSTASVKVTATPGVQIEILNTETRINKGEEVQLETHVESEDTNISYHWTPGKTLSDSTSARPVALPYATTTYTVWAKNSFNCNDSTSFRIVVDGSGRNIEVEAERVFTPNDDGINDIWVIQNINDFATCSIVIMNRHGQKVFEAPAYNNDWTAVYKGKELPEETYYYILKCNASEVHTGSITVLR